jgi:hypothetical protein
MPEMAISRDAEAKACEYMPNICYQPPMRSERNVVGLIAVGCLGLGAPLSYGQTNPSSNKKPAQ